ncbi:MAG: transposase, partial [Clostridiales bacterium]|nr:transposase [Clostridiales bacterium]
MWRVPLPFGWQYVVPFLPRESGSPKNVLAGQPIPSPSRQGNHDRIDMDILKQAVEEKPDAYLKELAELFDCS